MINEIRTLLGNRLQSSVTGSEVVDPAYTVFPFSSAVDKLRGIFGLANVDSVTSNFSLAQVMRAVHQADLKPHLVKFDSRISYDPFSSFWFDQIAAHPVVVSAYSGSADFSTLRAQVDLVKFSDLFQPPVLREFVVAYKSPTQVKISSNQHETSETVTFDSTGVSNWIWLEEPFLRMRIISSSGVLVSYFRFVIDYMNYFKYDVVSVMEKLKAHQTEFLDWSSRHLDTDAYAMYLDAGSIADRMGAAAIILAARMRYEYGIV